MKLDKAGILITGAAGGIGSCTARRFGAAGARLLLTDFRPEPLEALVRELESSGVSVRSVAADLGRAEDRERLVEAASDLAVDCLVNVAGINPFGMFEEQSPRQVEQALAVNALAPIQLCHAMLPILQQRDEAHIVNVGSVFGSLGYPGFTVYSASKFAIRGFTEALRRELADTPVRIHYVAPRATRTALSTDRVCAMNEELKVAMDPPELVARAIEEALSRSRREVYLGRPERLFGLLNSVLPGLIDRALRKQLPVVRRYASRAPDAQAHGKADSVNMKILGAQR